MNRAVLQCLKTTGTTPGAGGTDMSVLETQTACIKYWPQEEQLSLFVADELNAFSTQPQQFQVLVNDNPGFGDFVTRAMKLEPGIENGWPDFGKFGEDGYGVSCGIGFGSGPEMNYGVSRTANCSQAGAAAIAEVAVADTRKKESVPLQKPNSASGRESFKKRKADKNQNLELAAEDETREKKFKRSAEERSPNNIEKNSNNNNKSASTNDNKKKNETSVDASKDNSKVSEVQKPDYIHVRARRGQATDSHSLAERVRREKISERMKYLQDLVPGCNKITGKAGMLDEIINYVQSLQRQVEFLSMKLAAVNPRLDFNINNLFTKEIFPACTSSFPAVGASSDMANLPYLNLNPSQEVVSCCGLEMGINAPNMALQRTINAPISIPETFLDAPCFNQIQTPSTWDSELQNIYGMEFHQDRLTSFPSQPFTGLPKQESYQNFNHTIL